MTTDLLPAIAARFARLCAVHKPVRGRLSRLVLFIHLAALAAVGPAAAQSPFTLRYSLFDPSTNVAADALHGYSVALDESTAVVGAPGHEYSFIFGAVNIYDSATGRLLYTLFDPFKNWNARFGQIVAVSGRRVVVSAPTDQGLYL